MTTLRDVVTHEDRADLVRESSLLHGDLQQRALARVHGRVAELVEVHFTQTLQALEVILVIGVLLEELRLGCVVAQVLLLLADQRRIQRWLRNVDVAVVHHLGHLSEEERE